jgi:hypothetical protein
MTLDEMLALVTDPDALLTGQRLGSHLPPAR